MKTWRKATAGTAVVLVLAGAGTTARADYQYASDVLEGGTLGGTRGLRVRRIGAGSASFSQNGGFVFYPASSWKVLEHYYAMSRVQAGDWTLAGTTTSVCPADADNCGPGLNAGSGCGAVATPLDDTLSAMMKNSSNEATNAVQERVGTFYFPPIFPWNLDMAGAGRFAMNQFAASIGLTDSALNHKFGCAGFCGNPTPNALTLVDAERLYRSIATDAAILSPALRNQLKDLMLNESGSFLDDVIDEEAASTGKNPWKDEFRDLFFQIYKPGSWTCSDKKYISRAGLIQVPTYNGAHKRLYTWGLFAHDTEAEFYLDGTDVAAARELLRLPIRAALLTWGFGYAVATQAEGVADRIDRMPVGTSPAGPMLGEAASALRLAAAVLQREPRDYAAGFALLREAAVHLEAARRLDRRRVRPRLVRRVEKAAWNAARDVEAYVTMTSQTAQASAIQEMERRIGQGRSLARRRAYAAAVAEYEAAAGIGAPLIDWADRGTPFSNPDQGFIGLAAQQ
jgi:hypothetical protein